MIKNFKNFINEELSRQTMQKASNKLQAKGHTQRADEIIRHKEVHSSYLSAMNDFSEINKTPLKIWDYTGKEIEVLFCYVDWMAAEEDFIDGYFNTITGFLYKSGDKFYDYPLSIHFGYSPDATWETQYKPYDKDNKHYRSVKKEGGGITMHDLGETGSYDWDNRAWPRFTSRRDAIRFKNEILTNLKVKNELRTISDKAKADGSKLTWRKILTLIKSGLNINDLWVSHDPGISYDQGVLDDNIGSNPEPDVYINPPVEEEPREPDVNNGFMATESEK